MKMIGSFTRLLSLAPCFLLGAALSVAPVEAQAQNLYVSNSNASVIGEYNGATGTAINASLVTGLNTPRGVRLSGNTLYVSNYGANTFSAYNATTGVALSNFTTITGLNSPEGVVVLGNTLLIASLGNGTVGAYNATTGAAINTTFVSGLSNAALDINVTGANLYVAAGNTVALYNALTGTLVNANFITGLSTPRGLAVSGNTLYVSNSGSGILGTYNATTGAAINANFLTGLTGPTFIDVVPEPSSWALVAFGVAGLGMVTLRRRAARA